MRECIKTRLKLKPGQKGTKAMVDIYGKALFCVRYRYDEENRVRLKTVELIVEEKQLSTPERQKPSDCTLAAVSIPYSEQNLRKLVKSLGGRWDPDVKLWYLPKSRIVGTELEKHIVIDTKKEYLKTKASNNRYPHLLLDA